MLTSWMCSALDRPARLTSHIAVHRKEVHDANMQENQEAAKIREDRMEGLSCEVQTGGRRTAVTAATRVNQESTRPADRRIA